MNTYCKGIIGIKINGKLNFMLAERGTVINYSTGQRLRHYKLSADGYNVQYTKAKEF